MAGQDNRLGALVAAAAETARGMDEVAGCKPDETPLKSDARTFRGIATMLAGLSEEARQRDALLGQLAARFRRIADIEVRGGTELIGRGDWRAIAAELQAIASEALTLAAGAASGVVAIDRSARDRAPRLR